MPTTPPQARKPLKVNVIRLVRTNGTTQTSRYFGTLQPRRTRTLRFAVEGQIESVAEKFDRVKQDDVLAQLDISALEKERQLVQTTLDQRQSQFRDQRTQQLENQLAGIDEQLKASQIKAPFDSIVEDIFAFEGSLVRPQTPVLKVIDAGEPKIKMNLPRRIARLISIQPDREWIFGIDDTRLKGQLKKQSVSEDPAGSLTLWFDVTSDLSKIDFAFQESVEARFELRTDNSGYWIPLTALCRNADGIWSVFVVIGDEDADQAAGRIARRLVRIVQLSDKAALVDGDFKEGETVVANGTHRVVPSQAVNTNLISFDAASGASE